MSVWVGGEGREELCVQCELWRGRSVNLCVHRYVSKSGQKGTSG